MRKINVLVVDDSALVRQSLKEILSTDPDIASVETAADAIIAAGKINKGAYDVITLDIQMPRMDGLTFLKKLMGHHPIPVVICSAVTQKGSDLALKALNEGAVDVIPKPRMDLRKFFEESRIKVCDAVKAAALARIKRRPHRAFEFTVEGKLSADAMLPPPQPGTTVSRTERVVVAGASTGGTDALLTLLRGFPADGPGMVIVQHMPEKFTAAFARRLDTLCAMTVREAADGDTVSAGTALVAPGNLHVLLKREGRRYLVEVKDGPLVCRHRPSVDILFRSAARYAGRNAVGVIMTGMGDDGAQGMVEIRRSGGLTIAQDEATSVVFGMPSEAIRRGGAEKVLPVDGIAAAILQACRNRARTAPDDATQ